MARFTLRPAIRLRFIAVLMCSSTVCATQTAASPERRVDSLFASFNQAPSPGVAAAVVRDGKIIFHKERVRRGLIVHALD